MKQINYFIQFIIIVILFFIFKILGYKLSSALGGKIFEIIGPLFRSKRLIQSNIKKAIPNIEFERLNKITKSMWNNYGRVFAEYMFIKDFNEGKLKNNLKIEGQDILDNIKKINKPVIFISGHLANFELMAMHIEKSGIKLSAIYRPLNNIFLNKIMERIRRKYICKFQIKKGIAGVRKIINMLKDNYSTALMIDQRVSEGIKSNFFNKEASTTTIPAQFIRKFNAKVVPIYIKRLKNNNFKIKIYEPITFKKDETINSITLHLNKILEKMIIKNPEQWIWMHNRWK